MGNLVADVIIFNINDNEVELSIGTEMSCIRYVGSKHEKKSIGIIEGIILDYRGWRLKLRDSNVGDIFYKSIDQLYNTMWVVKND